MFLLLNSVHRTQHSNKLHCLKPSNIVVLQMHAYVRAHAPTHARTHAHTHTHTHTYITNIHNLKPSSLTNLVPFAVRLRSCQCDYKPTLFILSLKSNGVLKLNIYDFLLISNGNHVSILRTSPENVLLTLLFGRKYRNL